MNRIVIIAEPNGAGKTTFAREFLSNEARCSTFINADLIAAGISPFASESVSVSGNVGMGRNTMTAKKSLPNDADLVGAEKALRRAAKTARTLAWQTKTPCYVVKDGEIVVITKRKTASGVAGKQISAK